MKYLILLFVVTSCTMTVITPTDFDSIESIYDYCLNDIEYLDDKYAEIKLQYPQETIDAGTGDCEDKALLFLSLVNKHLGIKGLLVLTDSHALTFIEGKYYDPTKGYITKNKPTGVKKVLSYDVTMQRIINRSFE